MKKILAWILIICIFVNLFPLISYAENIAEDFEEISLMVGNSVTKIFSISSNSTVEWNVDDESIAGVYQPNGETNKITIVGRMPGVALVTATIRNSDNSIINIYTYNVSVADKSNATGAAKNVHMVVNMADNCDVYYCEGGRIIPDSTPGSIINKTVSGPYGILIMAAPHKGYALSFMGATGGYGYYYTISNGKSDGTGSQFYKGTYVNLLNTARWSNEQLHAAISDGISKGCDGALLFTRGENVSSAIASQLSFYAEKLPALSTVITSVNRNGEILDGSIKVKEGDIINYSTTVSYSAWATDGAEVNYTNIKLKDTLTDLEMDLDNYTSNASPLYLSFDHSYVVTSDDVINYAGRDIINNVELTYMYSSKYSNGSYSDTAISAISIPVSANVSYKYISATPGIELPNDLSTSVPTGSYKVNAGESVYTSLAPTEFIDNDNHGKWNFYNKWIMNSNEINPGEAFVMPEVDVELLGKWTFVSNEYTVKYIDENDIELSSTIYHFNDSVVVPNEPNKESNSIYKYEFAGWQLQYGSALQNGRCVGDAIYKAIYKRSVINYTVRFWNEDGTELISEKIYNYGDTVIKPNSPALPHKTFIGWDLIEGIELSEEGSCQGDAIYVAKYNQIIQNDANDNIEKDPSSENKDPNNNDKDPNKVPNNDIDNNIDIDIPSDLNNKDHVAYVHGYKDGTVAPNKNITRAETATMLYRLLTAERRDEIFTSESVLTDVAYNEWYNKAVSSMANGAYIVGYEDGTFRPDEKISRAEFTAMLVRFLGIRENECHFSDISVDHWAYPYIATASSLGWVNGYEDNSFRPEQPITRAEAVAIINQVLHRGIDQNSNILAVKRWPDNERDKWYYFDIIEASNSHTCIVNHSIEHWDTLVVSIDYNIAKYERPEIYNGLY